MYGFGGLQNGANKIKITLIIVVGILLIALVGLGGYVLLNKKDESPKATPASSGKDATTTTRIISKVGKLYDVPSDEEPTVAAIQDRSKLDGQEFFNKAKNGDYLLVYAKAEIALLYREDINKLINVGPVNMENQENKPAANPSTDPGQ